MSLACFLALVSSRHFHNIVFIIIVQPYGIIVHTSIRGLINPQGPVPFETCLKRKQWDGIFMFSVLLIVLSALIDALPRLDRPTHIIEDLSMLEGHDNNIPEDESTVTDENSLGIDGSIGETSSSNDILWGKVSESTNISLASSSAYYPWVVSIQRDGYHMCTGTLITPKTVITASSCYLNNPRTDSVVAYIDRGSGSFEKLVFKAQTIPYFDRDSVSFWTVHLESGQPADIPTGLIVLDDGNHSTMGTNLTLIGWDTSEDPMMRHVMVKSTVEVVSSETCRKLYGGLSSSDPFICAVQFGANRIPLIDAELAALQERPFDLDFGVNTGAPLFTTRADGKIVLVGVSTAAGCSQQNQLGVFSTFEEYRLQ